MTVERIVVGDLETNCYLVYARPSAGLLVDPGADAEEILDWVTGKEVTLKAIFLTHAHFDHILAAKAISLATGAPIYIHKADAPALEESTLNLSAFYGHAHRLTADNTVTDGDILTVGDWQAQVLHTPGHSVGCCCLDILGEDVLLSGDTLFADGIGRTDLPGGDYIQMQASLRRLAALSGDRRVYPGHGPATTLSAERRRNSIMA